MPRNYAVAEDYGYNVLHSRERLTIWSGFAASIYEGDALSLPKGNGYMITTVRGNKIRVIAPTPRDDENYQTIDAIISDALKREGN